MSSDNDKTGVIVGDVVSVRFAYSGRVAKVKISLGSHVSGGQILASLDRTQLQIELDKELKDFERIRADFEIFVQKQGSNVSDLARYEKIRQQSLLDVSVKAVELAKLHLDQIDLVSPVKGIVVSDGGLREGLNITPSANPVEILDSSSLVLNLAVDWKNLNEYQVDTEHKVRLSGHEEEITATVLPFVPPVDSKKSPLVRFRLDTDISLFPGMKGEIL